MEHFYVWNFMCFTEGRCQRTEANSYS